jgi:hypothetical protein
MRYVGRLLMTWVVVLVVLAPAMAQTAPKPSSEPADEQAAATDSRLANLKFTGGTVGDYVQAVRRTFPDANILMDEEVERLPMPEVELTSVGLKSALQLLEFQSREDPRGSLRVDVHCLTERHARPVYRILARVRGPQQRNRSQVWTVADLLAAEMKPEDVLSAVETAMGLLAEDGFEPAQIRFHEATGLLVARGHEEQINAIDEIVDRLRETVELRREAESPHWKAELENARERLMHAQQELDAARERAEAERARRFEERKQMEVELVRREAEMRELAQQADELRALLERKSQEAELRATEPPSARQEDADKK